MSYTVKDLVMVKRYEDKARVEIDRKLRAAGWFIQDNADVELDAGIGIAVREVQLSTGPADYLLFVNGQPVGVIEAKKKWIHTERLRATGKTLQRRTTRFLSSPV